MDTIVWRDEYSVGVVSLDEQHKTIVQLINRLIEHCEENVNSEIISDIFNEMTKYIKQHLEYEESLLKENNYPDLIEHVASHTKYIEEIAQISYRIMQHDSKVPVELLLFLNTWWEEHILIEDQKYSSCLVQNDIK